MKGFAGPGAVQDLRFVAVDLDITSLSSLDALVSVLEPTIRAGHIGKGRSTPLGAPVCFRIGIDNV